MLLWSHYANCHKGFCVEYDMRCLKEDTRYRIKYQFEDIEKFNEERLIGCIKAGLFPIVYSNKIVNITPSILNRFFKNQTNDIFFLHKTYSFLYSIDIAIIPNGDKKVNSGTKIKIIKYTIRTVFCINIKKIFRKSMAGFVISIGWRLL